ncbi:MAG: hypothetical protein ACXIUM_09385 [Wenzhouxiangella sp.]
MSFSPFAALQSVESRLVPAALQGPCPEWVLEVAPATSPSPRLDVPRSRILLNAEGCCWPFSARLDQLPLDSESVPSILLRHVWQPALRIDPLIEALRVLKPGGLLISVSANPWHPQAWKELGSAAMWLPSWSQFQLLHSRHALQQQLQTQHLWRGLVPGLTPVLMVAARKPQRPAKIRQLEFARPAVLRPGAAVAQCRAA